MSPSPSAVARSARHVHADAKRAAFVGIATTTAARSKPSPCWQDSPCSSGVVVSLRHATPWSGLGAPVIVRARGGAGHNEVHIDGFHSERHAEMVVVNKFEQARATASPDRPRRLRVWDVPHALCVLLSRQGNAVS